MAVLSLSMVRDFLEVSISLIISFPMAGSIALVDPVQFLKQSWASAVLFSFSGASLLQHGLNLTTNDKCFTRYVQRRRTLHWTSGPGVVSS